MPTDWRQLCDRRSVDLDGQVAIVKFENGRKHRVRVEETDLTLEMHAVAARPAVLPEIVDLPLWVWRHNRSAQLVSFRIDTRGRICGRGWVAKAGLTAEEFQLVLRRVAVESDRLEFLLTGRDTE